MESGKQGRGCVGPGPACEYTCMHARSMCKHVVCASTHIYVQTCVLMFTHMRDACARECAWSRVCCLLHAWCPHVFAYVSACVCAVTGPLHGSVVFTCMEVCALHMSCVVMHVHTHKHAQVHAHTHAHTHMYTCTHVWTSGRAARGLDVPPV